MGSVATRIRGNAIPARYEIKYVIQESLAQAVADYAQAYCEPDPFLSPGETEYTITTLYMDSPDLRMYWEKKMMFWDRVKLRVRTYGRMADGPVFMELKRRYGDIISKSRTRVERDAWTVLVDDPTAFNAADWPEKRGAVIQDFCMQSILIGARPVVVLRYDRESLVARYDRQLRVTFDRGIRFCRTSCANFPDTDDKYLPLVFGAGLWTPEPRVVLEMKFSNVCPLWMQDMVERFNLDRGSFSKYVRAMDQALDETMSMDPCGIRSMME